MGGVVRHGARVRVVKDSLADDNFDRTGMTGRVIANRLADATDISEEADGYSVVVRLDAPEDGEHLDFRSDELEVVGDADE